MGFEVYTYLCRIQSTYVHTGQFMVLRKESVCRSLPSKTSPLLKGGRASGPQKYNAVPRPLTAHIFNYCLVFSPVLLGEILMDAAVIHGSCGNPCDPPPRLPSENWTVESAGKHGAHSWLPFFSQEKHAHVAILHGIGNVVCGKKPRVTKETEVTTIKKGRFRSFMLRQQHKIV